MSLEDLAVYVFVQPELGEQDQRIQLAHAVLAMALKFQIAPANYKIVELDGGFTQKAFNRTVRKMSSYDVPHVIYSDSDRPEWGPTAIATIPAPKGSLPHKMRRYSPPVQAVPSMASGEPSSCSSEKEHLPARQEVVGSIPTGSSSF